MSRNRSTRGPSTAPEPCPSSRASIARPSTAPAARPTTAAESPRTDPPIAEPAAAPAAESTKVAMSHLMSGKAKRATTRRAQGAERGLSTTPCPE